MGNLCGTSRRKKVTITKKRDRRKSKSKSLHSNRHKSSSRHKSSIRHDKSSSNEHRRRSSRSRKSSSPDGERKSRQIPSIKENETKPLEQLQLQTTNTIMPILDKIPKIVIGSQIVSSKRSGDVEKNEKMQKSLPIIKSDIVIKKSSSPQLLPKLLPEIKLDIGEKKTKSQMMMMTEQPPKLVIKTSPIPLLVKKSLIIQEKIKSKIITEDIPKSKIGLKKSIISKIIPKWSLKKSAIVMEKSQQKQQQEQQVIKQSPSLKHIEVKKSEIRREKSVSQPPIFKVIEVVNIPRPFKSNSVAMMKPQEQQQQQQPLERETTTQSLRKTTSKAFGLPVDDLSISITHRKSMMINGDVDRPIDVMNNTTTTQQQLPETISAFSATEKTQETRPWLKDMIKLNKEMSQTKTNNNKSSSTKSSSESASESSS